MRADTFVKENIVPASLFKYLGITIAIFLTVCYLIPTLGYYAGINTIHFAFILSVIISLIPLYCYNISKETKILILILFLIIFPISGIITVNHYDENFDSLYFHQPLVISLMNGYNPVSYNSHLIIPEIDALNLPERFSANDYTFTKIYAKSLHIVFSVFASVTGNPESAKGLAIVTLLMTFSFSFVLINRAFSLTNIETIILSLVIALSPVAICNSLSFSLDGILYQSLISISALLMLFFIDDDKNCLYCALILGIFFVNIKHASALFYGITVLFFMIAVLLFKKDQFITVIKILAIFTLITLIFSYHPYVQNFFEYGEPTGLNDQYLNFSDIPENFKELNSYEKFISSIFSKATNSPELFEIRPPFLFSPNEIGEFQASPKLGGYGPLFSGILILSLLLFITQIYGIAIRKPYERWTGLYLYTLIGLILSIEIFNLSWYSRYFPQGFLIPILFSLPYLKTEHSIQIRLRQIIVILLIINLIVITGVYFIANTNSSLKTDNVLDIIESEGNSVYISVDTDHNSFLTSFLYKLIENDVEIHFINETGKDMKEIWNRDNNIHAWIISDENYIPGTLITFGTKGNADRYLKNGWFKPSGYAKSLYLIPGLYGEGPESTWTLGDNSTLLMKIQNPPNITVLSFNASPYTDNSISYQNVSVLINDNLIGGKTISNATEVILQIPDKLLINGTNTITFNLPDAKVPGTPGLVNEDRKLGIAINSLSINPGSLI